MAARAKPVPPPVAPEWTEWEQPQAVGLAAGSLPRSAHRGRQRLDVMQYLDYLVLAALFLAIVLSMGLGSWVLGVLQRLFGR